MAPPIKFRAKFPKIKIVNRCIICGKVLPRGSIMCSSHEPNYKKLLKKLRGK